MSTVAHEPKATVPIPQFEPGERGHITLPECPVIPPKTKWTKRQLIMWAVLGVLVLGMLAMFTRSGTNMMTMFFPVSMIAVFGMMMWSQRGNQNQNTLSGPQVAEIRRKTLVDLDVIRDQLEASARKQYDRAMRLHPDPGSLCGLIGSAQMWERSCGVEDYTRFSGEIRVGIGTAKHALEIMPWGIQVSGQGDPAQHEPVILEALNRLEAEHSTIAGVPVIQSLTETQILNLEGERELVYGLVRSMICQAVLAHSPLDLKVMVVTGDPGEWEWIKWLPHARDEKIAGLDMGGPGRLIWSSAAEMFAAVANELTTVRTLYAPGSVFTGPHWLIFNDADFGRDWDGITGRHTGAKGCTFVNLKAGTDG